MRLSLLTYGLPVWQVVCPQGRHVRQPLVCPQGRQLVGPLGSVLPVLPVWRVLPQVQLGPEALWPQAPQLLGLLSGPPL